MLDKPAGPTSHDVVAAARRALGTRRVGHAGTLDPFASGLLPLLVGRGTRLMPYLVGLAKRYTGVLRLGVTTETDDATGVVVAERGWRGVTDDALAAAMTELTGVVLQVPPVYSAKKVGGTPAHRRVRRGETVDLAPRSVRVHRFAIVRRDGPDVTFEAEVGSGTYVRALARDLGSAVKCGAHLRTLRRTAVGEWRVEDAVPFDALGRSAVPLAPLLAAVPHLPRRDLSADEAAGARHGRPVPDGGTQTGPLALVWDGELLAIAVREGDALHPRAVLVG